MKIQLLDTQTNKKVAAQIRPAIFSDMPLKKDGWNFNWRELFRTEGAIFYKIILDDNPYEIQGVIMLTMLNGELVEMKNIEVSPTNYGSKGILKRVAGCLIAYACQKSLELGKGSYQGCISFISKTDLMYFYQEKYHAIWSGMGTRMFIEPIDGKKLIDEYLNY